MEHRRALGARAGGSPALTLAAGLRNGQSIAVIVAREHLSQKQIQQEITACHQKQFKHTRASQRLTRPDRIQESGPGASAVCLDIWILLFRNPF